MASEPTIASSVVRSLCDALSDQSALVQRGLTYFGLSSITDTVTYDRVPLNRYLALFEWLSRELDRPNLGLQLSNETGVEAIGAVGYLFLSSGTLEQAFTSLVQNLSAIQDVSHMTLSMDSRYAMISYRVAQENLANCRQDNEYSLAFMWRLAKLFTGNTCPLVQVDFEHAKPDDVRYHRRVFGAPVLFSQPNNNLYLPVSAMQMSAAVLDSRLHPILQTRLSAIAPQQAQQLSFSDRVVELFTDELLRQGIRAKLIAARLGMSTATLHRRIRGDGNTFKGLLDGHCKMLAQRMLSQHTLPVSAVARRLGYAETACLTRAFQRWFGMTPRQYRSRQRKSPG